MRRILGMISIGLGAVLVGLALLLLVHNQKEDREAGEASDIALERVKEALETSDSSGNGLLDPETGLPATEMKTVEIDGHEYIGYLSVPALNRELPIMSEWSYSKLKIAPCREVGAVNTKDLVIAGHNYKRHFGGIQRLEPGELVLFTDMNQVTTVYTVEAVETLQPEQVKEMREEKWDLTLYTCTYGGKTRIAVRCKIKNS